RRRPAGPRASRGTPLRATPAGARAARRRAGAGAATLQPRDAAGRLSSTLDRGPGLHPLRVGDARVAAVVTAVARRRLPEVDLLVVRGVVDVVGVAEGLVGRVRAGLRVRRRLAEPLRH